MGCCASSETNNIESQLSEVHDAEKTNGSGEPHTENTNDNAMNNESSKKPGDPKQNVNQDIDTKKEVVTDTNGVATPSEGDIDNVTSGPDDDQQEEAVIDDPKASNQEGDNIVKDTIDGTNENTIEGTVEDTVADEVLVEDSTADVPYELKHKMSITNIRYSGSGMLELEATMRGFIDATNYSIDMDSTDAVD